MLEKFTTSDTLRQSTKNNYTTNNEGPSSREYCMAKMAFYFNFISSQNLNLEYVKSQIKICK